ncbi:MAG: adenylosuccinate lyase [Acidobacteria bacterium]|nr:adenylosuccinate lyase [Acidobacteriota bacterium]
MIARYTTPEMERLWSDENRFRRWLDVEIAVCRALSRRGIVPPDALAAIERNASFRVDRIAEIEKTTHHDVIAFTTAVAETLGEESRFVHFGLTSTDVVDTAQGVVLQEASTLIRAEVDALLDALRDRAFRHRGTPLMGRTHGVHAEPTSLGLKFALWYAEMERNRARFDAAARAVACGKISGAVGTFAHLEPSVEEEVCAELGIGFAPVSTQVLQRDRHAHYLSVLAVLGGTLEKIALEVRHLQRTEVREAEEPFRAGQKGSSAMPHKRNPVKCEQVCGLVRVLRANALAAMENQALWHERDISHSSAERVVLPDSTTLAHYLLRALTGIVREMHVYPEAMRKNLELSRGMAFSGQLLLQLALAGVLRETAYAWVQRNAMAVWERGADFLELVLADPDIRGALPEEKIRAVFDTAHYLRHEEAVFRRVFEARQPGGRKPETGEADV